MHAALTVAAFAVGALAAPYKRDVVYDYDVVYVTDVVTVTAGQPAAYQAAPTSAVVHVHHGHGGHHWRPSSSSVEVVSTVITSSYEAPLPTWTPEPETSTTSTTPVYTPPPTTSSSEPAYTPPAPTSTVEPVISALAPIFSSEAPTSSSAPAAPTGYQSIVLYHHNAHRANHSAPDLTWDDDLANRAQIAASACLFQHDMTVGGGGYGQNIAAAVTPDDIASVISDMFYNNEEPNYADFGFYGQANPDWDSQDPTCHDCPGHDWGHFTQMVWKSTQNVGCATVYCPGGIPDVTDSGASNSYNTVCNYSPPGNVGGAFGTNVGEPKGDAVVSAEAPGY